MLTNEPCSDGGAPKYGLCWLAREQAHSLCEEVEERAHRGNHSAPRRENRVHDSHVSLQRRQQSDERAALQIVRNGEMWDKECTNPLQRSSPHFIQNRVSGFPIAPSTLYRPAPARNMNRRPPIIVTFFQKFVCCSTNSAPANSQ
jgi:hypothetical protein